MKRELDNFNIRKSKDDAVYQYLLDHSTRCGKGMRIEFFLRGRGDWDSRVKARMDGKFRYDERLIESEIRNCLIETHVVRRKAEKNDRLVKNIRSGSKFLPKLYLKLYWFFKKRIGL